MAISTAIGDAIGSDRDEKEYRKNQYVPGLENYFTEGDYESWQDPHLSIQAHTNTMALRMYRWGIVCPDIPSLKKGASICDNELEQVMAPDEE